MPRKITKKAQRQKPKTERQKTVEKLAKDIIVFLRKRAIEEASSGKNRRAIPVGSILNLMNRPGAFDTRSREYRIAYDACNKAAEIGLLKRGHSYGYANGAAFQYVGPEVEKAEARYKKEREDTIKLTKRNMRKLKIRNGRLDKERWGPRDTEEIWVEMKASDFNRIAQQVK